MFGMPAELSASGKVETTAARQIRCKEKRDEKSSCMNEIAAVVR